MKLSIVIPALNEEKYLPKLLDDISSQEVAFDFEVVVVDSCSDDNTSEVAKEYSDRLNIQVIRADERGVGLARNLGARHASGQLLLFLDADIRLPRNDFLDVLMTEQSTKNADLMTTKFRSNGFNPLDRYMYWAGSKHFQLMFKQGRPQSTGCIMVVDKQLHIRIGGFDEQADNAEDTDYSYRLSKIAQHPHFVAELKVIASNRRFVRDGRWSMIKWNLKWTSSGAISLPGTEEYRFGHYEEKEVKEGKEESKELNR